MVVMLIMSIILAAMAPVMTTRSKADSSSPWRYSPENLSDAFFGSGESQVAMIGQPNKLETDDPAAAGRPRHWPPRQCRTGCPASAPASCGSAQSHPR